jgi:hypothetical protein
MGEVGGLYDARLEVLADAALVEAHLAGWAAQRSLAPSGPWRRVYGKLRPGHSPWARLVYEAAGAPTVQVSLLESDDPETEAPPGSLPAGVLGRLQILPCADDPALPGLPAVLAALDDPRVVRYHPGQRCMVHGGAGVSARYVKVFSDEVDDQREARARWAASVSGALSFAVAEPHGWDAQSRSSWYGVVPGGPVSRGLMGPQGRELARRVGAAVGELASGRLRPGRRVDASAPLARTGRGLARAAAATPGLPAGLRRAGDSFLRAHQRLGERPLVPVHGAAHLGQWLGDGDGDGAGPTSSASSSTPGTSAWPGSPGRRRRSVPRPGGGRPHASRTSRTRWPGSRRAESAHHRRCSPTRVRAVHSGHAEGSAAPIACH